MSQGESKQKGKRGGARAGAGRPTHRATLAQLDPDLLAASDARARAALMEAAPRAWAVLVSALTEERPSVARVSAATRILDRALGKPREAPPVATEESAIQAELLRLKVEEKRLALEKAKLDLEKVKGGVPDVIQLRWVDEPSPRDDD
jgi:hypothetical protein